MKTSAMIFAAGLGSRLYPLTRNKPKALIAINGTTLLESAILKIINAGITNIVINVHHFADQIIDFVNQHSYHANIQISDEREALLDTGGGLKKAQPLLEQSDHVLLYNVDILSNIDLKKILKFHIRNDNLATIAVRARDTFRYFIFNQEDMKLCGWKNKKTNEEVIVTTSTHPCEFAFSGIHIIKKTFFEFIPSSGALSMTPLYLELCREHPIIGYVHQEDTWFDVGKYEEAIAVFGDKIQ